MAGLPFYGTDHSGLFAIERAATDRDGPVIERSGELIDTTFSFESDEDALRLLTFYFGDVGSKPPKRMTFPVGLFLGRSRGPT